MRACCGLEPGAPIIIVRRLLKFAAKPVVVDEIYLPGEVFPGLTLEVLQDYQGSLYSLFESRFGVRMIRAEERLRAVAADRASAELLRRGRGQPAAVGGARHATPTATGRWNGVAGCTRTAEHFYLNELS